MLLLLLTFLAVTIFEASPAPSLADTLAAVGSYSPRPEGSTAERDLLAMIRQRVSAEGYAVTPFDFSAADFAHSFSGCLRVDLPGASRDTFILAVPVDSIPSASAGEDGSINVALALDLLSRLAGTTPPLSLTVLFLGAERGDGPSYPLGSTLFLRDFRPDDKAAFLYLALRDATAPVALRAGGHGIVAPSWLVGRSAAALAAAGVPFLLPGDELQLFRMGTTNERTPIEPYLAGGYPAVALETAAGNRAATAGSGAAQAALAAFLTGMVAAGSGGIPDEWDRHYLLLQGLGASLIVSEQEYVLGLVCILAAAFLYALVFRRGLLKYLRTLARNVPAIVPIAACTFLFLAAGTYALVAITNLRAFPLLWTYAPAEFLALKLCVAVFLYAVLYNVFRRLPFPRNGSFFSASALLFLLVDIIVVAFFDISFTWYFVWAFVFVFFSAVAPRRILKALAFLPAPFWGIRGIIAVFQAPALPFERFLLLSPLWGNLLLAGALLPFVLMLLRLGLAFPGRGILRRRRREIALAGILFAGGAALAVRLVTFTPFSAAQQQPVTATQSIEVNAAGATTATALLLDSPGPLGALTVKEAGAERQAPPLAEAAQLPLADTPSPFSLSVDSRQFLQQRNLTVHLTMPVSPRSIGVTLTSNDDFVLVDSSFPSIQASPRDYRLLIGAYPPNPLVVEISLPTGGLFELTFTLEFDEPLIGVSLSSRPDLKVTPRVRVQRRLEVRT